MAGYLVVLTGQAVYRNYSAQKETKALKQRLTDSQFEREHLKALIVYYKTDSFKEKELRRALLLKKPNEQMYALPESSVSKRLEEDVLAQDAQTKKQSAKPIWKQWGDYLWGVE